MKINPKYKILLLFLILLLFPTVARAEEFVLPQYTEEYQEWLTLSEEEKQEYIEPQAYETILEMAEDTLQPFSMEPDNTTVSAPNLPRKYQRQYYGTVKNQGASNACWAYSSATMFETNYYLMNSLTKRKFSDLHMEYATSYQYNQNGFNRKVNDGGNIQIALAYATNGMGVALDSNMPTTNITPEKVRNVPTTSKVKDYIELTGQTQIKNYLYYYGVVPVYTYIGNDTYFSSTNLYHNTNLAYCCANWNQRANHAVTLIGWDDNYTNSSFPTKKGAYIALNSYGIEFGNQGLYYIFYDDAFVNKTIYGVTNIADIHYDYLYQHDFYGWTAQVGYETGTYAANVFQRQDTSHEEKLTEISSYFPNAGRAILYINAKGADVRTSSATDVMNVTISQPGYHTIPLNYEISLTDEQFTVGIKYPGIMGAEIPTQTGWCSTATSNFGESYISKDGIHYEDMNQVYHAYQYANACIKAFTKKGKVINEYHGDLSNYVFDARYYADHNSDLYQAFGYDEIALKKHWISYGKAEGRPSSSIFDVSYYAAQNPDIVAALGYNYEALYNHFVNCGYAEYRKSSPEFDGTYYKEHNGDLKNMTSMELIRHYALYGKNELRRASATYDITEFLFDAQVYATCNPDVVAFYGTDEYLLKKHWYTYGMAEGRIASLLFDARFYLNHNKDVANAYSSTNYLAAYQHFLHYGFTEKRQGNAIFSVEYYLANNTDLKNAYGDNYLKGIRHFILYGKNEKRLASSTFNIQIYQAENGDLRRAYQANYASYFTHYLRFGQYENRICL